MNMRTHTHRHRKQKAVRLLYRTRLEIVTLYSARAELRSIEDLPRSQGRGSHSDAPWGHGRDITRDGVLK